MVPQGKELRKGKITVQQWERGEWVKKCKKQPSGLNRKRCFMCWAEIHEPWRRPLGSRYFPAACGEDHTRTDIHTVACRGLHTAAAGYAVKEAAVCGEAMLEQVYSERLQPWRGTMLEQGKKWEMSSRVEVLWTDCPIPGSIQGQVGQGSEQPGLVGGIPAHGREVGTRLSLWSLPTQWYDFNSPIPLHLCF